MVTLADSLVSSSARMLPMRMRPDLTALQQRYQGQLYWVVKEPVGLHYFRFQEEEYSILQMLDGQTSLDEIKIEFESRFPPQKITVEELGNFVGMLHRNGLVIAGVAGQGEQLRKRRTERKWKEFWGGFANILALRFKGIDPNRILNWLYPKVKWFYSVPARIVCLVLALSALTLITVQFDSFHNKLPTFHQFFEAKNWIYLGITLGVTKVIHEFGHGLTCKHFGGECHEMGVMFLVLTPCLYCNVSDSWMLPNKWHRAWIGAAGMYIEIVIASICTFLWWFSEPGLLHQLCLSTMFVCSVSTVMFNANPLLRYDGYYILSDIMEIPNLRQKSSSILNRKLGAWCLGLEEPDDPFLPQRNQMFFALYTVAAAAYRWVILFGIIFFLYKVFEPYGLKVLSQMLAIVSIVSLVATPLWKMGKFFYVPGRLDKVKRTNVNVTLAILTAVGLFIVFCPLPYRVLCTLEIKPRGADPIYAKVPGILEQINVKPGQQVKTGAVLGRLSNVDLALEIGEIESKIAQQQARLAILTNDQFVLRSEDAAKELPESEKRLEALREQLQEKKEDEARLQLVAHADGTVMPPPEVPSKPEHEGDLKKWSGSPLNEKNLGAYLTPPALYCQVGDPCKMEAILYIDQDDIEFVRPEQALAIKLDEIPYRTFHSKIAEIGEELKLTPRSLSSKSGGELMSKTDESGTERPINTTFQARCNLDLEAADAGKLVQGLRGTAKIHAEWQPIGKRVWRYLVRTFNFKL
jgi:putative peptide zinc metalloprotease protein